MATVLEANRPGWRSDRIVECSPAPRGISWKLAHECPAYTAMNYFPGETPGETVQGVRNENLESMTFADGSADVFVALDVLEHVSDPAKAVSEISRVLSGDGLAILTFPIRKDQVEATIPRAILRPSGTVEHLTEPEYHGNPFSSEGALVFTDFGYDVHVWLESASGRDVQVIRFADRTRGIRGEYTDVCVLGG